jgi:hypothetical protein
MGPHADKGCVRIAVINDVLRLTQRPTSRDLIFFHRHISDGISDSKHSEP